MILELQVPNLPEDPGLISLDPGLKEKDACLVCPPRAK